jgi:hypothetical protein
MRKLREWIFRISGLFNKQRKDQELDDEIKSHLQMHHEDNLRLGMAPEEAPGGLPAPPDHSLATIPNARGLRPKFGHRIVS